MNLGRDMKGNNKVFYRHINIKRKTRKNMGRCLMEQETKDTEKAKVLNDFFTLVFTGRSKLQ